MGTSPQKSPLVTLKLRGANLEAARDHSHELMLSGPADTGKSVALCAKHIIIANSVPNLHGALVRKTYKSLNESIVKTFNRLIVGLNVRKMGGTRLERYVFANGSEIVLAGLDAPERLLSSEWDTIQACQSEEFTENDWEILANRVTGRGAVFRHPSIFGDCNPSYSKHWIRTRKSLKLLVSHHKDNPELYDDAGRLTEMGRSRMAKLETSLTGIRKQRLLMGVWATAEGVIYEMFVPTTHVCEWRPEWGEFKEIVMSIDAGYTNPAAIIAIGIDGDDRWHVFRQFYQTNQLQGTVVKTAKSWSDEFEKRIGFKPMTAVDEAAPGLIADLLAVGVDARGAKGRVEGGNARNIILDGIQAVQNRLHVRPDGRPGLTVDPSCGDVINEFESYVWKKTNGLVKDEPLKENDHSMDALRYIVAAKAMPTGAFSGANDFYSSSPRLKAVGEEFRVELDRPFLSRDQI